MAPSVRTPRRHPNPTTPRDSVRERAVALRYGPVSGYVARKILLIDQRPGVNPVLHRAAHESSRPRSGLITGSEKRAGEMLARVPALLLALGQGPLLLSHRRLELALVVESGHDDVATLSSVRIVAVMTQDPSADRVILRVHPWHGLMVGPHRVQAGGC
jgi:hypothetical protein